MAKMGNERKMEKLKTLKDLGNGSFEDTLRLDLKMEAIKWVKEFDKRFEKTKWEFELDGLIWYGEPHEGHDGLGARMFLMHFFNLTEEDLK